MMNGDRWMAQNVNYKIGIGKSWCYDDEESNCAKYGRLYDWNTAKAACPAGWHLPSDEEWNTMVASAGGKAAGKALKSSRGHGTDDFGFSALLVGYRKYENDSFNDAGNKGYWWTATERGSDRANYRYISSSYGYVYSSDGVKSNGYSVRCVAD